MNEFLSGECCISITKNDLLVLNDFFNIVGNIKWADGKKLNSNYTYNLANRYEKIWIGYSDEVTFSTSGSWKDIEYTVSDFVINNMEKPVEISEEEIIRLMGD